MEVFFFFKPTDTARRFAIELRNICQRMFDDENFHKIWFKAVGFK